jgi:hypothetical protein
MNPNPSYKCAKCGSDEVESFFTLEDCMDACFAPCCGDETKMGYFCH